MDIALKRLFISMFFPGVLLLAIWLIFLADITMDLDLVFMGLYPRKLSGLQGIILSPLIHGGIRHIVANSFPLFILSSLLFYFYREVALKIILISWITVGSIVWLWARPSYHVGASGLIYSLAGFLMLSGLIRRHLGLIAVSLVVILQYGSMIWGVFPIEDHVSWESHLTGLATGLGLAWFYRKKGAKGSRLFWQGLDGTDDPSDDESAEMLPWDEYELEGKQKAEKENPPPDKNPDP